MVIIDERQSEGLAVVRHQADAETHGEKSSPDLDNSTLRVISTIFLNILFYFVVFNNRAFRLQNLSVHL